MFIVHPCYYNNCFKLLNNHTHMYTLRKITGQGIEMNFSLGNGYTLIRKDANPEEFQKADDSGFTVDKDKCFAVISCNDGKTILPLFNTQKNYIMTESGKTFSNITC